ncbi:MAG TPA: alcohol dehydrogenase [Clostridiales bacterium]|nr:alcohol dehydrogenase [Clostridiales bacterium]
MSYFEFINQVKICSGDNALCNVVHELKYLGATRPLILSDKGLEKVGTLKNVIKVFNKNELDTTRVYTDIPTDSSTDTINQIVQVYKDNGADSIVAIGGGSVIDTAKGVKLVLSQEVDDILKLEGNEIMPLGKLVPFIVIPTTCGTGSECTAVAVIKNSQTHVKMEFISPTLLPNVAVLDSSVIETLPPKLLATTSIDALTHAIEGYSCLQRNPISQSFSITAIRLITENLFLAINHPKKVEYKYNLLNASTVAGISFSNSMVGIVHAIGHALGSYKVPHGNAMAILLPTCLKFNADVMSEEYSQLLLYFKGADYYVSIPEDDRPNAFVTAVKELVDMASNLTGFSLKLTDYGITENDLEDIANTAINDGASAINPKLFTRKNIISILKEVL